MFYGAKQSFFLFQENPNSQEQKKNLPHLLCLSNDFMYFEDKEIKLRSSQINKQKEIDEWEIERKQWKHI